ncbi:SRPBCC domain-containing protein [Sphingobacterium sp. LRF_L2]|uniref:SRPBCC domain-containing protein n=1 Tax=Sphingobacterium sp. LRF_L2 TaxID=3369421 RepID=UPI003F612FBF
MKKLTYNITIKAPRSKVFETMLSKATYQEWTSEFDPTSDFEGNWQKGSKMYFTAIDKEGKKGGMIGEIMAFIPDQYVSIRHYGVLDGQEEVLSGAIVDEWAGGIRELSF